MKKILVLSLGCPTSQIGIINQFGEVEKSFSVKHQSENFLPFLFEKTRLWVKQVGYSLVIDIERIGISVPGIVNHETGMVINAPLFNWTNFDLKEQVKEYLSCKPVTVVNNVVAESLGEYWLNTEKKSDSMVYYSLGNEIGLSIIFHGKPLLGEDFVGSQIIQPPKLTKQLKTLAKVNHSTEQLSEKAKRSFKPLVQQMAHLINALNFKTIVIGGKASQLGPNFNQFLYNEIMSSINDYSKSDLNLVLANYNQPSEIIGCAYYTIIDGEWEF